MRLRVLRRDEVVRSNDCEPPVAVAPIQIAIGLQTGKMLDCPGLQDVAKVSKPEPSVTWPSFSRQNTVTPD